MEIVRAGEKNQSKNNSMNYRAQHWRFEKTLEINYVRRRLSSSIKNVSNMRIEGAMEYKYKNAWNVF